MLTIAGVTAAAVIAYAAMGPAQAGEPNNADFLALAGTDMWREGAFLYGGLLWSPGGIDSDGFTLKAVLSGGGYTYPSGALHLDVGGTMVSAAALPGWRFTRDGVIVSLFAGPLVQDYRLVPDDPGSRLRGGYVGGEFATDVWYQPSASTMAAFNGSVASIGPTGSLRVALGWRLFEPAFVGPEAQSIWCAYYDELRLGTHVTAWRLGALEWSAGGGWAMDTDRRAGPYVHLDFGARY